MKENSSGTIVILKMEAHGGESKPGNTKTHHREKTSLLR
jgi:hypothetical protein